MRWKYTTLIPNLTLEPLSPSCCFYLSTASFYHCRSSSRPLRTPPPLVSTTTHQQWGPWGWAHVLKVPGRHAGGHRARPGVATSCTRPRLLRPLPGVCPCRPSRICGARIDHGIPCRGLHERPPASLRGLARTRSWIANCITSQVKSGQPECEIGQELI